MTKEPNKTRTNNQMPILHRLGANVFTALSANKATVGALALLLGGGLTALATDNRAPEVPDEIAVGTTNKVHFHGFGVGVQIYTWNGTTWGAPVPEATLFDGNGVVATHFAGPRWQSNSGSIVRGAAVVSVTVDTNAIPWVLLRAVPEGTHGPGIFANTTFIQRVNTAGGKAPSANGAFVGQIAEVPYTADYFFFRKTND
jgi:uncharacterized protein DUF3455